MCKRINMRLDKFLKVSRLVKRRTVANSISDLGRVFVNGNIAKPAKQLKVGDIIEIEYANRVDKFEVLIVPSGNVSAQEAGNLYRQILE
jgi:ribosomal 50S subunit-recycling heat shock protein